MSGEPRENVSDAARMRQLADAAIAASGAASEAGSSAAERRVAEALALMGRVAGHPETVQAEPSSPDPDALDEYACLQLFADVAAWVLFADRGTMRTVLRALSPAEAERAFVSAAVLWEDCDPRRGSFAPLYRDQTPDQRRSSLGDFLSSWNTNLDNPALEGDRAYLLATVDLFQRRAGMLRSSK